jgi:hypothetical protein
MTIKIYFAFLNKIINILFGSNLYFCQNFYYEVRYTIKILLHGIFSSIFPCLRWAIGIIIIFLGSVKLYSKQLTCILIKIFYLFLSYSKLGDKFIATILTQMILSIQDTKIGDFQKTSIIQLNITLFIIMYIKRYKYNNI